MFVVGSYWANVEPLKQNNYSKLLFLLLFTVLLLIGCFLLTFFLLFMFKNVYSIVDDIGATILSSSMAKSSSFLCQLHLFLTAIQERHKDLNGKLTSLMVELTYAKETITQISNERSKCRQELTALTVNLEVCILVCLHDTQCLSEHYY